MYTTKNCKMTTPWGQSDYKVEYQRGLFFVNTPGHGGLAVSKGLAKQILSDIAIKLAGEIKGNYVFFEEDCAVCVAALDSITILSHMSRSLDRPIEELKSDMVKSVSRWYPQYLE